MNPSEVRNRVLADHELLRERLARIEILARTVLEGRVGAASELRDHAAELGVELSNHFDLEDDILVEVLRNADPWGPERVARLQEDHARQRQMLAQLRQSAGDVGRPDLELALTARGFVQLMFEDMEEEERLLLSEDLLRDDIIALDGEVD